MHSLEIIASSSILVLVILALEIGYHLGRRTGQGNTPDVPHLGAVLGGMMGLMGLLLAFSFGGAAGRFLDRQQLVVREANAIGTAYLRAELLPSPHAAELQQGLRDYTDARLKLYESRSVGDIFAASALSADVGNKVWASARAGVVAAPQFTMAVLPPVNEVIDLNTTHLAAIRRHLPWLAMGTLVLSTLIALMTIGFSAGLSKRRNHAVTLALALLVGLTLWITIDLDYPRLGFIKISDEPMLELKKSFTP